MRKEKSWPVIAPGADRLPPTAVAGAVGGSSVAGGARGRALLAVIATRRVWHTSGQACARGAQGAACWPRQWALLGEGRERAGRVCVRSMRVRCPTLDEERHIRTSVGSSDSDLLLVTWPEGGRAGAVALLLGMSQFFVPAPDHRLR